MNPIARQLKETLLTAGWTDEPSLQVDSLDSVLLRSYAAVGLLVVPDARAAIDRWITAQSELADLRTTIGPDRDLYLLICVPEIEPEAMDELPALINDTHICRKFVLELRNRGSEEALADLPVLFSRARDDEPDESGDITTPTAQISARLLDDLGKRSPTRILDSMLAGEYEQAEEHED